MVDMTTLSAYHTSEEAKRNLRRRRAAEGRFKFYGMLAIGLAVAALISLVVSIGSKAVQAFFVYETVVDVAMPEDAFDEEKAVAPMLAVIEQGFMSRDSVVKRAIRTDANKALKNNFIDQLGGVPASSQNETLEILSGGNIDRLNDMYDAGDLKAGGSINGYAALLSDDAQLYIKGAYGQLDVSDGAGVLSLQPKEDGVVELLDSSNDFRDALALVKSKLISSAQLVRREASRQEAAITITQQQIDSGALTGKALEKAKYDLGNYQSRFDSMIATAEDLEARAAAPGGREELNEDTPSVFVFVNGGTIKLTEVSNERALGVVMRETSSFEDASAGQWRVGVIERPESARKISDVQVVALEALSADGKITSHFNWEFLSDGDSREADLAGVWGGLVGSFWTMLVTFLLAFPLGVMAAIYLEEFARKSWFTDFVEVNINNLAAIPSIIFGLFGLLLLLSGFEVWGFKIGGWFKEYRSAAFVGGIVLALMTLPTIIIAGRAAIRAVPPSIRSAAYGLGASKVQTVFHHVLPLAMPGIMTGTIIGMAQALGETAPILMVGMVGFFADVATDVTDPTTVMPALVYFWSDYPENLFEYKTSLAIVVLLLFLVAMNAFAVFVRKRFERRW